MAVSFIPHRAIVRSNYGDHSVITESIDGGESAVIWDNRSGLPDPDADKPYHKAWWEEFDTPDGYSKNGSGMYGASATYDPTEGLKTVWDSRTDGIPQEWRNQEAQRRSGYDAAVEYAREYRRPHGEPGHAEIVSGSVVKSCNTCKQTFIDALTDKNHNHGEMPAIEIANEAPASETSGGVAPSRLPKGFFSDDFAISYGSQTKPEPSLSSPFETAQDPKAALTEKTSVQREGWQSLFSRALGFFWK